MDFTHDPPKAARNLRKHKISFEEALSVFEGDPFAYTDYDADHSIFDERFITIGQSSNGTMLFISHNEVDGLIHIISVRRAKPLERKLYEDSQA